MVVGTPVSDVRNRVARRTDRPVAQAASAASPDRAAWPLLPLVFVLAVLPFLPAQQGEFLTFDDDAYVSANRFVLQGLTAPSIRYAFTTFSEGNYHPLTWLSLMLDAQIYGANAGGFHLTSLLLHGANASVFCLILLRVGATPLAALLGALLWALHPARVESAAWISERKDVLSALFGLLAIHAYLGTAPGARPGRRRLSWVTLWMGLSLLCKAMFVTLPALLVLLDFWPLGRLRGGIRDAVSAVVEKWPLWLLSASFSALAVLSQRSRAAMMDLERMPLTVRLPNAVMSYGRYLGTTLWPSDLAAFYPFPLDGWATWQWVGMAVVLAAITAAALCASRRWPSLLVGWGWYVVALLPVSGVMQTGGQALADRFTYLPAMGLVLGVVGVLPAAGWQRRVAGALAAAACLLLAVLTWQQSGYWRDTVTLMERTLAVTPLNLYAQSQLAHAHLARGENDKARAMYEDVLRMRPDIAQVQINLGVIAAASGDYGRAITHYREGIRLDERSFEAYNNLAAALLETKDPGAASAVLEQALLLRPQDPDALFNLGLARSQSGDFARAAEAYEAVLAVTPNDAEAHYRAGALRMNLGDRAAAERHFRATRALEPAHPHAGTALRQLLASSPGGAGTTPEGGR